MPRADEPAAVAESEDAPDPGDPEGKMPPTRGAPPQAEEE
jgi:hypothetical protein